MDQRARRLTATFDGISQVLLEWDYNSNEKQFAEFNQLVYEAHGVWRKRKDAKYFGRLVPWRSYQDLALKLAYDYDISFTVDSTLQLEVVDVVDEMSDFWPRDEVLDPPDPVEWWGDDDAEEPDDGT